MINLIYISQAIAGLEVGLESIGDNRYTVWFCRLPLGELDRDNSEFQEDAWDLRMAMDR